MASKLHIAKIVPTRDKQDACQLAEERAKKDKEDLQELTVALVGLLKMLGNGEMDD